jgi:hypothetical protein
MLCQVPYPKGIAPSGGTPGEQRAAVLDEHA